MTEKNPVYFQEKKLYNGMYLDIDTVTFFWSVLDSKYEDWYY